MLVKYRRGNLHACVSRITILGNESISSPEHARSQVKCGHSSGEIEMSSTPAWQLLQDINKVFRISFENLILSFLH
jgi:hypothetical protein